MKSTYDVIVVGAGITGASAAYWLKKKGVKDVLLLERGQPASGGTGKSAAIVRSFYTIPLMARLAKAAVELFSTFPKELGKTGGFHQVGFTQVFPQSWATTAKEKVAMHQALGIKTSLVERSEWAQRFPWLNLDGVGAIVFESQSGYADPVQTTEAFVDGFKAKGGEVAVNTPCRGLVRDRDHVSGVLLEDGAVRAGTVINAAGPWAKYLAESIGLAMPLRAVREQDNIWEVRPGRPMPTTPLSNAIEATYMRPMGEGRWLLGRGFPKPYYDVDPYNYKQSSDNDIALETFDLTIKRVPTLEGAKLLNGYAALYDVTPDWMPFMGPRSGLQGYADACGGSGHAFKTGPIFARELVDWLVDGTVRDDFRQLSYDRIGAGNLFNQSFGGNRV